MASFSTVAIPVNKWEQGVHRCHAGSDGEGEAALQLDLWEHTSYSRSILFHISGLQFPYCEMEIVVRIKQAINKNIL